MLHVWFQLQSQSSADHLKETLEVSPEGFGISLLIVAARSVLVCTVELSSETKPGCLCVLSKEKTISHFGVFFIKVPPA